MEQCKTLPEKKFRQWHPAFYAGTQIEFQEEATNLIFENEHQLGTKPMEIDILIIKKESGKPIQKNIGKIFRKYNVVEYKTWQIKRLCKSSSKNMKKTGKIHYTVQ